MILGYGLCGNGEAQKYMRHTLDCFKRLTDKTVILLNNAGDEEKALVEEYGFDWVEDNREWGINQWKIKQDFLTEVVSKYNPDYTLALDMDEELRADKEELIEWIDKYHAIYVYVLNLWDDGYNKNYSFWNVRAFSWKNKEKYGDMFYEYEKKPVHCGLCPKWTYFLHRYSPFVLLHHGLKDKKDRMKRVERYNRYDKDKKYLTQPEYYTELATGRSQALNLPDIEAKIRKEVLDTTQPVIEPIVPKIKETVFVKREHDGLIFDIPKDQLHTKLQQTYVYQGKTYKFQEV